MISGILTSEQLDFLLSVSTAELKEFLGRLPPPSRKVVQRQLLNHKAPTERCEQSLYEFVQQAWHIVEPDRPFIRGWHIAAICMHLEAVYEQRIRDLLINLPPGHCKSRICNVFFPAWVWTKNPSARFLHASYAQELATRDSVDCRYIIGSPWYQERWGHKVKLTDDQNQKIKFSTSAHGWRMATSIDGRGTGEHPDFIIVDDPHNVRQAESDAERLTCLRWWDATIASRGLIRGVRKVVIMQRLHVSDLSGHILERGGFDHILLPYEFEPGRMTPTRIGWTDPRKERGELLWPAVPDQMKQAFANFPPRLHAGQLQQRPVPEGGGMFKREWFKNVARVPSRATQAVRYWDKAASEGAGDYSAGVLIVSFDQLWYVTDVIRGRWSVHQRNQIMRRTAENDSVRYSNLTTVIEQEPGSGGKESAEHSRRMLAGFHVKIDKVTGAKEVRAQPLADQCEGGNVLLVQGDWNTRFVEELCVFPAGDHDDQVDAAAGAFQHSIRVPPFEAASSIGLVRDPRRFGILLDPNGGAGTYYGLQLDRRCWPR